MNDQSLLTYTKYVRPELGKVLSALKLDVIYKKALGDKMFCEMDGRETIVSDFLGGFGSTILGHNHPDIIAELKYCQDHSVPQHAQASLKKETALLAETLNSLTQKKMNDERVFITTFANSGTEAVEVALKHALLEWNDKREKTLLKIRTHLIRSKNVPEKIRTLVENYCKKIEDIKPIMLSLEKSFHGKTSGSIALTANSAYKKMFQASPVEVKFFSLEEKEAMLAFILASDMPLILSPEISMSFNPIVGFIYEPIQGEGGIEEVPAAFLKTIAEGLKIRHIPLICDEIQSGLYRTGKFLCSEWSGVKPDYILLGKSLGGGVAKISATMIARDHYVDEFGWIHTSTFAEDDWSSLIAARSLSILQKEENEIVKRAEQFEAKIRSEVEKIQKLYPDVINGIKGRGFFLGVEFNFDQTSPLTDLLNGLYEQGHATYVFTSYLLHHHQVRVGVTLSAPEIIRLEPAAFVTQESVSSLILGLTALCEKIASRKTLSMISHLWTKKFTADELATVSEKRSVLVDAHESKETHIGFLTHVVNAEQARSLDLAFSHVEAPEIELFLSNYANQTAPFRYFQKTLKGKDGSVVVLNLYGIMQPSSYFETSLRNFDGKAARLVQEAVDLARIQGMSYFGLGQFTSIVSENGMLLQSQEMPITTGNSLTAAMAIEGIKKAAADKKIELKKTKVGVVGFTGNICNVLTQIIADDVEGLVLIHRDDKNNAHKYNEAVDQILSQTKLKKENISIGHDLTALKECAVVIVGTNSASEIILSEHVKEGAIVLDISIPSNVQSAVKKRADVSYFQAGLAKLPDDQIVDHPWVPLKTGDCFACMAETIVMGFLKEKKSYSLGRLNKEQVVESLRMAGSVGITLGGLKKF
jgi:acetylornithine/succinyldiaminopimelate/putrescine aminotransferase/predicted amino acid dehydrogenase